MTSRSGSNHNLRACRNGALKIERAGWGVTVMQGASEGSSPSGSAITSLQRGGDEDDSFDTTKASKMMPTMIKTPLLSASIYL